ncbi:hypothetical protein HRbin37_02025 [bacterium HR37]|jgi:hypothetical protein|nr:hypothetical protein HRbin37_02025 [bacterium HR37]
MTRVEAIKKMIELGGWNIEKLDGDVNSEGIFEIKHDGSVIGWMTEGDGKGLIICKPFSMTYVEIVYDIDNYKPANPSFDKLRSYVAKESIKIWNRIK